MPPKSSENGNDSTLMEKEKKSKKKSSRKKEEKKEAKEGKDGKKEKVKQPKHRHESLHSYLRKLLKQVHRNVGIQNSSLAALDLILKDLGNRFDEEAAKLCKSSKKKTITQKQMQTVVGILLPGELAKHALAEGNKATAKYNQSKQENKAKQPKKDKKSKT